MWTDPPAQFPTGGDAVWWEVWLRRRDGQELERAKAFAQQTQLQVGPRTLAFTDRVVVLLLATAEQLTSALDVLDDLAELRRPRVPAELLALEGAADQADWAQDLLGTDHSRIEPAARPLASSIRVCTRRILSSASPCRLLTVTPVIRTGRSVTTKGMTRPWLGELFTGTSV